MNPVMFQIGNFEIRWYSFFIIIAFALGYFIVTHQAKKNNIKKELITDLICYLIPIAIIGARLYYCIFEWNYYKHNLIDIIKIWEGGLAIHGGIIASIICIILYTKKHKIDLLKLLDIFAPALIIGQAIGRWGNFFNSEAFGSMTTLSNLKSLYIPKFIIDGMYIGNNYYHPTFFYESIGCLIGFIILIILTKNKKIKTGIITSLYLIIYGTIRFFIESMRQDSLMLGSLKVAQLVSIIMILIGISISIYSINFKRKK